MWRRRYGQRKMTKMMSMGVGDGMIEISYVFLGGGGGGFVSAFGTSDVLGDKKQMRDMFLSNLFLVFLVFISL